MSKELIVLQGKTFFVELQSMAGSTNYGWCVKSMPEEIILTGIDNIPVRAGIGPLIQRFYFGVVSAEHTDVEIDFVLTNFADVTKVSDTYKASVRIIQSNSEEFVSYSENDANPEALYGFVYAGGSAMKYGYPCGAQDAVMKYGYPCGAQDTVMKYGYPCGAQDTVMKYGYPCGAQDTVMKYGYPCGAQDTVMKYGYPCGVQDAVQKYGFPCVEYTKDSRPYGFVYMG